MCERCTWSCKKGWRTVIYLLHIHYNFLREKHILRLSCWSSQLCGHQIQSYKKHCIETFHPSSNIISLPEAKSLKKINHKATICTKFNTDKNLYLGGRKKNMHYFIKQWSYKQIFTNHMNSAKLKILFPKIHFHLSLLSLLAKDQFRFY